MHPLLPILASALLLASCSGTVQAPTTLHPPVTDLSGAHVAYNSGAVSSGASDSPAIASLVKPEDADSEFAEECTMSPDPRCVATAEDRQRRQLRANAECRKRDEEFSKLSIARRTAKAPPNDPGIDYPAGTEQWDVSEAFDVYDPVGDPIDGCGYVETVYSATPEGGLRVRRDLYVESAASPMFSCTRGWTPGGWEHLDGECERLEDILAGSGVPRTY